MSKYYIITISISIVSLVFLFVFFEKEYAPANFQSKEIIGEKQAKNVPEPAEVKSQDEEISSKPQFQEPEILSADPTNEEIEKYGIKELIGQGTSNFRGSPKNRLSNIRTGALRFNRLLIKPGEEFSFINVLGPVDATTGYLPELVIKDNKTIPEYGGGVCQVSTTMFRAALNAGLEITSRSNHAYPVQYYAPVGLDATVYIPKPDLMFVNNTPNHIFVKTRIEGTKLFFDFYGTDDGRKTKVIGPKVLEKNSDGSMKTVAWQEVYDVSENLLRKWEFESSYKSPSLYPHPGEEKLTEKPKGWSKEQWKKYKKANGI